MTYPQQPGNWTDPSNPSTSGQQPAGYPDPAYQSSGQPDATQQVSGQPDATQQVSGQPDTTYQMSGQPDATYQASGQPGAQSYAAPVYPAYGYQPVATQQTNSLAIASLVCSLAGVATCITAPIGAILGHVARKQIRERGEGGDGMALAGIIVGWIFTGLLVLLIAFYVVMIVLAIGIGASASSTGTY